MKFIKHLLACVAAVGLLAHAANAAVTLSLTPVTSSTVSVGDSVQYYLTISGLKGVDNPNTALSGYIIDLEYDSTKVTVSLSSYLTSFGGVTETNSIAVDTYTADGLLSLAAVSSASSSAFSSQVSSFTLATITVTGQSAGSASVSINSDSSLSDQDGNTVAVGSVSDAAVTVVPEPSTAAFVGLAGLLAVMRFRRRFAQVG